MNYEQKKKEWDAAQPMVSKALALKPSFQPYDERLEIPEHYLQDDGSSYGTYITNNSSNFEQFTKRKLWQILCNILDTCNKPPFAPAVDETGRVTYYISALQFVKPSFSVPIAKLMELLVIKEFSDELIDLSYKVMQQFWFEAFTVAEEIERAYNAHFA